MLNQIIEYIKLHKLSLEQDCERVESEMDSLDDWGSDEYNELEIEQISLNGQIMATIHILEYCLELDKSVTNGVK